MFSQLGQVLVGVADSVMVGRVGKEALAGASLGNSVFVLFLTFGIGVSYGITPLVAQADGENDLKQSIQILKNGLLVNIITGILLFILLAGTSFIFPYLDQPDQVVKVAVPYYLIISVSIIPFMIFQTFRQYAEGLSLTRQAMIITLMGNLLNIVLNYMLIFGKLGFPAYGLKGAGIATLVARIIMAAAMGVYVYYGKRFYHYWKFYAVEKLQRTLVRKILNIGLPSGMQFIFEVGAFSFAAIMVGWMGTTSLAAHQIAISLAAVTYMMATGIAMATTIRVGNQLGRKDMRTLRSIGFTGFFMGASFMGVSALLLIIFKDELPYLFIREQNVIDVASHLILIAAFFQISDGLQVVGLGALRGMSDVKIPTWVTLVSYWVLALPAGYILGISFNLGPGGVWLGLLTGLTVTALLLMIRFDRISRSRKIVHGH